jgi:hypothetical protein
LKTLIAIGEIERKTKENKKEICREQEIKIKESQNR